MQRAALAIAKDPRKSENARLSRRQQLFHRKFGRRMEMSLVKGAVRADHARGEAMQMGLVAGRDLQRRRLDLDETFGLETAADLARGSRPREEAGPPVGVAVLPPKRRGGSIARRRSGNRQFASDLVFGREMGMVRAASAQASNRQAAIRWTVAR
jgi:hypothetical protein